MRIANMFFGFKIGNSRLCMRPRSASSVLVHFSNVRAALICAPVIKSKTR
jgi:hypothetical protein